MRYKASTKKDLIKVFKQLNHKERNIDVIGKIWEMLAIRDIHLKETSRVEYTGKRAKVYNGEYLLQEDYSEEFLLGWCRSTYAEVFDFIKENNLKYEQVGYLVKDGRDYLYNKDFMMVEDCFKFGVV